MVSKRVKQIPGHEIRHKTVCFFICTFLWGLLAHAYGFLHSSFVHDGLNVAYIEKSEQLWKIAIGRIFVNLYRSVIRGNWEIPWLIGVISLCFIAVAVRLLIDIFEMNSFLSIIIISGMMVVNPTVTSLTATYIYEMDIDMLAMLLAVVAVFCWRKSGKTWLIGIPCICFSLGLYQAYISVTLSIMLIFLIKQLLDGWEVKKCLSLAIKGGLQVFLGGILYLICLFAVKYIYGIDVSETNSYNSLSLFKHHVLFADNGLNIKGRLMELFLEVKDIFIVWIRAYWGYSWFSILFNGLFVILLILGCIVLFSKLKKQNALAAIVFVILLPPSMDVAFILSGCTHSLMEYAFVFVYLFAYIVYIYIYRQSLLGSWSRYTGTVLVILLLLFDWNRTVVANTLYLQRELQDKAQLSYMTRILGRLEEEPGFREQANYIAIIGSAEGMRSGNDEASFIYNDEEMYYQYDTFRAYCNYILDYSVEYCEPEKIIELSANPDIQDMPSYPDEGCVIVIDGIYIIKVSDTQQGNND